MSLPNNRFFNCFTDPGARALKAVAKEVSYNDGVVLFEEGDVSDCVYLVLDGKVKLSKKSEGLQRVEIAMVEAGDYFGELGVFDESGRSTRAESCGTVRAATIPCKPFLEILHQEPSKTTFQLFGKVLDHLRTTNDRFATEVLKKGKLQVIGEMASTIIHDLKNPIATIQIAAGLIERKQQDPEIKRKCNIIVQQSQRMVSMVQELLDFARGKPTLNKEIIPLSSLFEQFQTLNQDLLTRSGVEFSIQPIPVEVDVDPNCLTRVLQNLMGNALDAMGEKNGRLAISAREVEEWVEICMQDNGPGIPERIRDNLFDPFVTAGKKNGVGLGLSIVKTIIEAHGGKIFFKTETGKGTSFFIWLPRHAKT